MESCLYQLELPSKHTHLRSMKYNNNWYGEPENNTHIVVLSTRTIINLCLYVSVVTYVYYFQVPIPIIIVFHTSKVCVLDGNSN